uniref:Uncharacterized protein n=1 Tax=Lepeophtheirus salmonis TaxID=72036 RepID=A0A0K2V8Y3_LEPSM
MYRLKKTNEINLVKTTSILHVRV